MGLTLRQLLCSGIAIGLAVLIYLWAKPLLGQETASWLCILAAAPIAAAGFLSYDGLPFEKFVIHEREDGNYNGVFALAERAVHSGGPGKRI